jgi:hypothetical protein
MPCAMAVWSGGSSGLKSGWLMAYSWKGEREQHLAFGS